MIRPAKPSDIPGIVALGAEALEAAGYEGLTADLEKLEGVAKECVSSARHFAWVDDCDGVITGAVTAMSDQFLFYKGQQLHVVQFYAKRPGAGAHLLRGLKRWYDRRALLRGVTFVMEYDMDPRVMRLIGRIFGTQVMLPIAMHIK